MTKNYTSKLGFQSKVAEFMKNNQNIWKKERKKKKNKQWDSSSSSSVHVRSKKEGKCNFLRFIGLLKEPKKTKTEEQKRKSILWTIDLMLEILSSKEERKGEISEIF